MEVGKAYWIHSDEGGRVYIPVKEGRKLYQCLVFEADGLHKKAVPMRHRFPMFEEKITARRVRGHIRKAKPATKGAAVLKKELLGG